MIRVGVTGLGFMGKMHSKCYQGLEGATLAVICDVDESQLKGTSEAAGNIEGAEEPLDLSGVELCTDFDKMLAEADLDAVSITLPTYLHAEYTIKALKAGLNVLCEKPMAINEAHCIRFWPEYARTKKIIDSGKYGGVKAFTFQRLSLTPTWSWDNWLMDAEKSGGAILDLHIHDSDFVQYVFGMPKAVSSRGAKGPSGDFDHIVTQYIYEDGKVITAEGGWLMTPGFGFEMSFNLMLERATIVYDCTREPAFKVCPAEGDAFTPEVEAGDGYSLEIAHFVKAVGGESVAEITTPSQSLDSVRIVLAERRSAQSGREVEIR